MEKSGRMFAGQEPEERSEAKDDRRVGTLGSSPKEFDATHMLNNTSVPHLTRIAENSSVPATLLEQLAGHCHLSVKEAVADNLNTPIDTLWLLAADQSVDLRYAMAENHNLPIAILDSLSQDTNPYVAHRAQRTLDRLVGGVIVCGHFELPGEQKLLGAM